MSEINAIATNNFILHNIDAKKLYVQEPLFTANSGDAVYVGWRPDETVLYSGEEPTSAVSLSETWKNFDRLKIYVQNKSMDNGLNMVEVRPLERDGYTPYYNIIAGFSYGLGTNGMIWQNIIGSANDTELRNCSAFGFQNSWTATSPTVRKNNANDLNCILKVVGVNRKENV